MDKAADSCQSRYFARWGGLRHPHVRALAWLLDSPDLLDAQAPAWQGRIASLRPLPPDWIDAVHALDRDPAALDAWMAERQDTRLGLYAERLMAFFLRQRGVLVAHGLQVQSERNTTRGEFDFLLDAGPAGLEHWEFATKFYLLNPADAATSLDALVGPGLADTLGAKMRKIFDHQLALGQDPAAQRVLPRPVLQARALVKGWLFYPGTETPLLHGIARAHCRGFWCSLSALETMRAGQFAILPRLQWLAPWQSESSGHALPELRTVLATHFSAHHRPVLIARIAPDQGLWRETARGFVVPDDWQARAAAKAAPSANADR